MKKNLLLAIGMVILAGCGQRMTPKEADYTIAAIAAAQFNSSQTNWTMIIIARKDLTGTFYGGPSSITNLPSLEK